MRAALFAPLDTGLFREGQGIRELQQGKPEQSLELRSLMLAAFEGQLAFGFVADPNDPEETVLAVMDAILNRLGLDGKGLTPEQIRLKGWLGGLLVCLADSFHEMEVGE